MASDRPTDEATLRLLDTLGRRVEELAGNAFRAMREEIPVYATVTDPAFQRDVSEHIIKNYRFMIESFAEGRASVAEDLVFARQHAARRVHWISLADFQHGWRVGQQVFWDAVLEMAVDDASQRAALGLAWRLLQYINVASTAAAEVYLEAEALLSAEGERVRRDLLEQLLLGQPPTPGPRLNAARAAGLEADSRLLVVAATAEGDPEAPRAAANAIVRATGRPVAPLAVVRQQEVVVIVACDEEQARALTDRLVHASSRLAEQGVHLVVGLSTLQHGLGSVPDAYREACVARERVDPSGGVIALHAMTALDYLLQGSDPTARRLVETRIRTFVERDRRHGGVLIDTLREYVAADLNITRAADRLHVHVNTARYRLTRITEETARDLRCVADVLELLVAVQLLSSED